MPRGVVEKVMSQEMEELLRQQFTPEISEPLVELFQRAYQSNAEVFDPFIGHDEMVFGLMVHKSAKFFLAELARKEPWMEVLQQHPRFVFRISDYLMSAYRVGDSLEDDLTSLFPRNRTGAWMLADSNQRQMLFKFMSDGSVGTDDSNCRNVILAHVGNVTEGLYKLFLGVPSKFDDRNRITGWSTIVEIWSRDEASSVQTDLASGDRPPQPPAVKTAPPTLTLKNPKKQQENQ